MREGYSELLKLFSASDETANRSYEILRLKLVRFFEIQNCREAEECADETIHRVAQKLAEGVKIEAENPYTYCRGVALRVLQEYWRKRENRFVSTDEILPAQHPQQTFEQAEAAEIERQKKEILLQCAEKCLNELSAEQRDFFLEYHADLTGSRIEHRAKMAQKLNLDVTALRNRITRLRKKIEMCVSNCCNGNQVNF